MKESTARPARHRVSNVLFPRLSAALLALASYQLACQPAGAPEPATPAASLDTSPTATDPATEKLDIAPAPRPLLHWRDTKARARISAFVAAATELGGANYLPPEARIAVFDNDGTLWSEQPLYFQFLFALDRMSSLAKATPAPAWAKEPWMRALQKDGPAAVAHFDEKTLLRIVALSEAGISTDEFRGVVGEWLKTARHPRFERPYSELVFLPMLELLQFLRQNGFKTYIVSGGGVTFMRAFAEHVYGIPPEQVIGTLMATTYKVQSGKGVVETEPQLIFMNDGPGKPVGIERVIGRKPVFVAGNSDGDREMLEYAATQGGPAFGLIVHHDDAEREWAYDRTSPIGRLDKALDQAQARDWLIVSMKDDFETIYAPASAPLPLAAPAPAAPQ